MTDFISIVDPNIQITGLNIQVSAPGKVILNGEHSVVYGKLALAASVGLRTRCSISEIDVPNAFILKIHALDFEWKYDIKEINEFLLDQPLPLSKDEKEYNLERPELIDHDALLNRVQQFLKSTHLVVLPPCQALATQAFFYILTTVLGSTSIRLGPTLFSSTTELNTGAGLGSSASFAASASATLIQYLKSKISEANFSRKCYKPCMWDLNLTKFIKKELDLICQLAYNAEKIIHGTPSGLDNTICTYGSVVEYRKGAPLKVIKETCRLNLLLINSNVPRETRKLVAKVRENREKYPEIVDRMLDSMDVISQTVLEKILELSTTTQTDDVLKIYMHLSDLFFMNHNLLNAIGVGHQKLNQIVDILADFGISGKLTGGGGGGYAICLIPPNIDANVLEKVIKELQEHGFNCIQTEMGVEGVKLETPVN